LLIIASRGLADLLQLFLRQNPAWVSLEEFRRQYRANRISTRWPRVQVIDG